MHYRPLGVLIALLVAVGSAQAGSIGVNFVGGNGPGGNSGVLAASDVAGVTTVQQANWNNAPGASGVTANISGPTAGSLVDSAGSTLATTISWTGGGTYTQGISGSSPNELLMNGYLDNPTVGISLTSIPYAQYDVYVYFNSDTLGRTTSITDGTTSYYASVGQYSGSFNLSASTNSGSPAIGNYVLFSNESASSLTISTGVPLGFGIAGVQLVSVPEPGSLVMFGIGSAALCITTMGRRRKALRG